MKAVARHIRITPRKVRQVTDLVRGKPINQALTILKFSPQKRIAKSISTVLESAVANADQKGRVDVDNLFISRIVVENGPTMKRFHTRAKGQGMRILKRTCHIAVELGEK